jgi:hypothetical protein
MDKFYNCGNNSRGGLGAHLIRTLKIPPQNLKALYDTRGGPLVGIKKVLYTHITS